MPRTKRSNRLPLVLVVEDNTHLLEILTSVLENAGLRIIAVASAEDALEAIDTNVPDVLVTDFGMTGMNGVELAMRVQAQRPSLPVVITSGHPVEKIDVPPTVRFLAKPFEMTDLILMVREALVSKDKAA
jgi:DNA-binding NtrC family response regulator